MKNILLIGGNGFIGKNIIEKFLPCGYNITLLNRKTDDLSGILNFRELNIVEGELKNTELFKKIIINRKVDTIVHLASSMIPSSTIDDYYHELQNVVIPTYELLDLISELKIKFVFFSSGGTIYGGSDLPLQENHALNPINYYGYSKLICEQYIQFKNRTKGLKYLILRPSNAFGKYQPFRHDQGFITAAINKILRDEIIEIWGNGEAVRDFIEVQSIVDILHELLNLDICNEIVNTGSGKGYNLLEVLRIIENILGRKAKVHFSRKRKVDVDTMVLDITKLKSLMNYNPGPLEESIFSYIKAVFKNEI